MGLERLTRREFSTRLAKAALVMPFLQLAPATRLTLPSEACDTEQRTDRGFQAEYRLQGYWKGIRIPIIKGLTRFSLEGMFSYAARHENYAIKAHLTDASFNVRLFAKGALARRATEIGRYDERAQLPIRAEQRILDGKGDTYSYWRIEPEELAYDFGNRPVGDVTDPRARGTHYEGSMLGMLHAFTEEGPVFNPRPIVYPSEEPIVLHARTVRRELIDTKDAPKNVRKRFVDNTRVHVLRTGATEDTPAIMGLPDVYFVIDTTTKLPSHIYVSKPVEGLHDVEARLIPDSFTLCNEAIAAF